MKRLLRTEKHKDLVYDVGLHRGQDTDFYLKKGYRVVAFEADPDNVAFCRERFAREIAEGRLTIVEGAIAENAATNNGHNPAVQFYKCVEHPLWSSACEDWAARNEVLGTRNDVVNVPAVDFAKCIEQYGVPHYLKADIVGNEIVCLKAFLEFENKPEYISIRSEKLVFRKLEHEFDLLEQLGYKDFKAVKQDFERITSPLPSSNGDKPYHNFEDGSSGPFGEETSGRWKTRDEALRDYRTVFVKYWLFGDYSYLVQTRRGRSFIATLERLLRRSVPGWYDTHARLGVLGGFVTFFANMGEYAVWV